jgi:hypothetical protein
MVLIYLQHCLQNASVFAQNFKRCITSEFATQLPSRDSPEAHEIHTGIQYAAKDQENMTQIFRKDPVQILAQILANLQLCHEFTQLLKGMLGKYREMDSQVFLADNELHIPLRCKSKFILLPD